MTEAGKEILNIRRANVDDAPAVLTLFDEVIEWFVSIGNLQQWGSEPWSTMQRRITQVTDACALPGAWVAQNEHGVVRAFLALGESMPYVPAPTGPELYVRVLVASRDARVRGIGRRLIAFADEQARAAVCDVVVYERAQREVAREEAHVFVVPVDLGNERLLITAVGERFVASLVDIEMYISGRDIAVDLIGRELAALVGLIVETAVKRLLHDLLILAERHRLKARHFCPFRIGVPRAERRPVVVGAEIDVLAVVRQE